jgi:hypothetical protein
MPLIVFARGGGENFGFARLLQLSGGFLSDIIAR